MRRWLVLLPAALTLFVVGLAVAVPPDDAQKDTRDDDVLPDVDAPTGVAVVELYTSEGCSSCPPADRLLVDVTEEARADDRPVYPLAFHVDYWNQLGWTDPYSRAAFSERQRERARDLGDRVYTPMMVVNGTRSFVGSDASKARRAIENALKVEARATFSALTATASGDAATVTYDASALPDGAVVHLAVVERGLTQDVPRGENAGRTLRHANVVRSFETLETASGTARLPLPDDVDPSRASVIAYVQHPEAWTVYGAARTPLSRSQD